MSLVAGAQRPSGRVVEMRDIVKSYVGVTALDHVSVDFAAGRVHALVGENGAGKSTLIKTLTGAVAPDGGRIVIGDRVNSRLTPRESRRLGISVVHQERQIASDLTIEENLLLGRLPVGRFGFLDRGEARRRAIAALDRVGLKLDPAKPVAGLGVAEQQRLEIARALTAEAKVLILDEPTSAIGGEDVHRLFALVRSLSGLGVAVIYISHHFSEIFELADDVTTMRDGRKISTRPIGDFTPASLLFEMLGRHPAPLVPTQGVSVAEGSTGPLLRVENVSCPPALAGVSFDVRPGEVLAIAGGFGSGRRELAKSLAGALRPDSGDVTVGGLPLRSPFHAVREGVVYLPDDRKREALMLDLSIADNLAVGGFAKSRGVISRPSARRKLAGDVMRRLGIKAPTPQMSVRNLSGGNQQKVILGRWLSAGARVYIFDEPTAGIDVGAKLEIHKLLRRLVADGAAIVVFSSDYDEIEAVADRVLVLRRGRIVGEVDREHMDKDGIITMALGVAL